MVTNVATIRAARLLVAELGLSPDDLVWAPPAVVPTIAEYLPKVIAAEGPGARRTYRTYWERILAVFGDRCLDEVTATEIETLMREVMATTVPRRNQQGGRHAGEHLVAAMRAVYTHAVADGLVAPHRNPAAKVRKPRRPPTTRRALSAAELSAINTVAAQTGNDAALDTLILRLHLETACRRGAALALTEEDIDRQWCLLRLHEKNGVTRWQPVSPTLLAAMVEHCHERGAGQPTAIVLRYRDGSPITSRRYDHLWHRLGVHLPWVAKQNISIHWLRHTTLTWVERHYGYAVAHAYAGHHDTSGSATPTYLHAEITDIATALSVLTGEAHPLVA